MNRQSDHDYLIGRVRASLAMARAATDSAARLIHFDLAGRYSLGAVRQATDRPHNPWRSLRSGETSFFKPEVRSTLDESRLAGELP